MPTKAQKKPVSSDESFVVPQAPSKKKSASKDKCFEESKAENQTGDDGKNLGPEPKKPRTTFNYFNAEFVKRARQQNPALKTIDAFREAANVWSKMADQEKAPFVQLYA